MQVPKRMAWLIVCVIRDHARASYCARATTYWSRTEQRLLFAVSQKRPMSSPLPLK